MSRRLKDLLFTDVWGRRSFLARMGPGDYLVQMSGVGVNAAQEIVNTRREPNAPSDQDSGIVGFTGI